MVSNDIRTSREQAKTKSYRSEKDENESITRRKWTRIKDPHAPPRPRSAYVHFLSSRRSKYGTVRQGWDQKAINVALAAEWQSLTNEERHPFYELAIKENRQYQIEWKKYQKTDHYRAFLEKKALLMQLQAKQRKMKVNLQHEIDQLLNEEITENINEKVNETSDEKEAGSSEMVVLTMPHSNIPIFSSEFFEYDQSMEAKFLTFNLVDAEKQALETNKENIRANKTTYEFHAAYEMTIQAFHIIECWRHALSQAMGETMEEYHQYTFDEMVECLTNLGGGNGLNEDVLQAVKEVLKSVSFILPVN